MSLNIVLKYALGNMLLYLQRNNSVVKAYNKTLLSYKDIHWFCLLCERSTVYES